MKNPNLLGEEDRPAPDDLRFVQGLLNTVDFSNGIDHLGDAAQASAWLERFGLVTGGTDLGDEDTIRLRAFREAVRSLISQHEDPGSSREAARVLDDLTSNVALGVRFGPDGTVEIHNRSAGIDGAIGLLLVAITRAAASGAWQRLKICGRDSCRWAFYDASKNRSSTWCSMETCGNREKVARHRHRAARSHSTD